MKKTDLFIMSINNLLRRKFRTILTVLGVVIGCTSILMMLSLGLAMDKNLNEQMKQMGDLTQIQVNNYSGVKTLDDKAIRELKKVKNVKDVVPSINPNIFTFTCGKYRTFTSYWNVYVLTGEQMSQLGYEVDTGRTLLENESKGIVLGEGSLEYFTKNGKEPDYRKEQKPMPFDMSKDKITIEVVQYDYETHKPQLESENGKIKRPASFEVNVVGMLSKDTNQGYDIIISPKLYSDLKAESIKYRKALGQYSKEDAEKDKKVIYDQIVVKADEPDHVAGIVEALKKDGYDTSTNMEWINEMKNQSKSRQLALGGIGIVSFVVAAIGIANTMMMSIYERRKEIGIMKVIGAKMKDIKQMFMMESLLIGLFGGILGAVISLLVSMIMNASGEKIAEMMDMYGVTQVSLMTPELLIGGILFSVAVGGLSGYFPARKAMNLSALSAIKTE